VGAPASLISGSDAALYLFRKISKGAVVRVCAEDIVTGEIIAPVRRSRLVRYVEMFSEHRYGRWVLAAIAFADSSFLPIPPDLLLVPMALVRPKKIWALSLICTVGSSLGAVVGYVIGYGLWSWVGARLVELYGYGDGFTAYQHLIEKWGVWIIIAKSLTAEYGCRGFRSNSIWGPHEPLLPHTCDELDSKTRMTLR
jgi:membrane protein YqaA with SNARE-associated domain